MGKKIIINESQFDIIDKWDKLIFTYSGLDNPFILFENNNSTLCEGYYSTFTFKDIQKYVAQYLQIDTKNIKSLKASNGEDNIGIIIFDVFKNKEIVDKVMLYCGWFFSLKKKINDDTCILIYEKLHQNKVNDIVHKQKYIYHLTLEVHIKKILKIGLCPRSENKKMEYPERIYFMLKRYDDFLIDTLSKVFYSYDLTKEPIKSKFRSKYVLLKIDTSKISDDINYYYDPNLIDAVFTNDNISPNVISIERENIDIRALRNI